MRRVYKYTIVGTSSTFDVPDAAEVLYTALQHGKVCLWMEVDDEVKWLKKRTFTLVGTGGVVPRTGRYVGTVFSDQEGTYVFHVYEELPR